MATVSKRARVSHGIAHAYTNLEKLLSRDDVMVDSVAGAEIERLASHLRNVEQILLKPLEK